MSGYNSFTGYNVFSGAGNDSAISMTISKPIFNLSVSVTSTSTESNVGFEVSSPIFNIQSSVTMPLPVSDLNWAVTPPIFSISASVSGINIVVANDAIITFIAKSNTIIY